MGDSPIPGIGESPIHNSFRTGPGDPWMAIRELPSICHQRCCRGCARLELCRPQPQHPQPSPQHPQPQLQHLLQAPPQHPPPQTVGSPPQSLHSLLDPIPLPTPTVGGLPPSSGTLPPPTLDNGFPLPHPHPLISGLPRPASQSCATPFAGTVLLVVTAAPCA